MAASGLRLVHVSDLHIGSSALWKRVRGRLFRGLAAATDDTLRRLAQHAGRQAFTSSTDGWLLHCVASGDLTTLGSREEIELGLTYLETRLARLRAGLGYGIAGFSHVLGNHDVWDGGLARGFIRGTHSKQQVMDDMGPPHAPRTLVGPEYYADLGSLRVRIYLSIRPSPAGPMFWPVGESRQPH